MKNYLYLSVIIAASLLNSCAKAPTGKEDTTPAAVTPQITIHSLRLPNFSGSIWTPAMVGNVRLELDQVNSKDSVLSMIKDSASFANFSLYQKIVPKGTYNITYSSGTTAPADTFMRFNGQLKGLVVDKKQTLDLTASSNDGVITIDKSFIANGTIPSFKPDSGTKTYKLGLSNGFYYLYVKGGIKGNINFVEKTTGQTIGKKLSITALNQLNMAVVNNKGSLQITFVPFVNKVLQVSSNTLVVLKINPLYITTQNNDATWFVATDETGNILNEVKYVQGTTAIKINPTQPFDKERFNLFQIEVRSGHITSEVTGYLQIKRGSILNVDYPGPIYHGGNMFNVHLKNATPFDELNVATNFSSRSLSSINDTTGLQVGYPDTTRLWVQMLKNNRHSYNIFNVPAGTTNFDVDVSQLNKTSLVKTFTVPGINLGVSVQAKTDQNWGNSYDFGYQQSQFGSVDYYYPSETFKYIETRVRYNIGNDDYLYFTSGPSIPDAVKTINASFNVTGSTLADFVPSVSGTYDYYHANFLYTGNGPYVQFNLFSTAAANYTNIKLPDFAKYFGLQNFDLRNQKLQTFEIVKSNVFNESLFNYFSVNGGYTQNVDYRSLTRRF